MSTTNAVADVDAGPGGKHGTGARRGVLRGSATLASLWLLSREAATTPVYAANGLIDLPDAPAAGDGPSVYLTFDCESRGVGDVLNVLRANDVQATMFLLGTWVTGNRPLVRRMVDDGHVLGNHSYSHPHFPRLSRAAVLGEIERAEALILNASGGVSPRPHFRFPYGDGQRDPSLLASVSSEGYGAYSWTVDPQDWRGYASARIVQSVLGAARDGSVILMHPASPGTPASVQPILDGLRARGFGFKTL